MPRFFSFYIQIQPACVGVGSVARALRDILFGIKRGTGIWEVLRSQCTLGREWILLQWDWDGSSCADGGMGSRWDGSGAISGM